ncbi:MAG TPA: nucleoside deaminase [Pyrinomonadaceae bacterium]|jgi:tRNA(Arg) A34 adenosine deaminase TadA|nr:nucleoside deaminase [Pyrinomonadaceae bacterium]
MSDSHEQFMRRAIELAQRGVDTNAGGPFGCVVVKDGHVIGEGCNEVTSSNDPTAHAEVVAIRNACAAIGSFQLDGCHIYTSCEPCPMCLGAMYWARPARIFYAGTREDAASAGFDDQFIYEEMEKQLEDRTMKLENLSREEAQKVFKNWADKPDKIEY